MMHYSTVSHAAFIRAQAGGSNALGKRLNALVQASRHASGCLHFAVQRSQCDESLWLVSGFWASQQDMDLWFASPAMQVFSDLLQESLLDSLDLHTFSDVATLKVDRRGEPPSLRGDRRYAAT